MFHIISHIKVAWSNCAIIVFNLIFGMTNSSLYPTHTIICKVPQSSSEFQTQIQAQRPWRFSNALQRREPIGRWAIFFIC